MGRKIYEKETVHVVDEEGEIKGSKTTYKGTVKSEPNYVKMYEQDIGDLHKLNNTTKSIMNQIAIRMDYNNELSLVGPDRVKILEALEIKEVTLEKALTELVGKGIIKRISRGYYSVNAYYFAKGKWADIEEIRMTITYNKSGRNIKTEASKKMI